jgi:hypothetical protein
VLSILFESFELISGRQTDSRVSHAEHERLAAVLRPDLGVIEWSSIPVDLHKEERKSDRVTRRAVSAEESRTNGVCDVTLVVRGVEILAVPASRHSDNQLRAYSMIEPSTY